MFTHHFYHYQIRNIDGHVMSDGIVIGSTEHDAALRVQNTFGLPTLRFLTIIEINADEYGGSEAVRIACGPFRIF